MPVDRIKVAPALATECSSGALVRSPEPILMRGRLSDSRNSSDCWIERRRQEFDAALLWRARSGCGARIAAIRAAAASRAGFPTHRWCAADNPPCLRRTSRQRIGIEGLEFDDVGAGIGRGIDQRQRGFEAARMIDAGFGDDQRVVRPSWGGLAGRDVVKALLEQFPEIRDGRDHVRETLARIRRRHRG